MLQDACMHAIGACVHMHSGDLWLNEILRELVHLFHEVQLSVNINTARAHSKELELYQ